MLQRYEIDAAHRESGATVTLVMEAGSEKEATEQANAKGFFVSRVRVRREGKTRVGGGLQLGAASIALGMGAFGAAWLGDASGSQTAIVAFLGLAVLAALCGVAGVVWAAVSGWRWIALPLAGLAIASVPLISIVGDAWGQAREMERRVAESAATPPAIATPPTIPTPPVIVAASEEELETPQAMEREEWASYGSSVIVGDAKITLTGGRVGVAEYPNRYNRELTSRTREPVLQLTLRAENTSATRKVDFSTWRLGSTLGEDRVTLRDELGNRYRPIGDEDIRVGDAVNFAALYPGDIARDTLLFERPVSAARSLFLELKGGAVKEEGVFRFHISLEDIDR